MIPTTPQKCYEKPNLMKTQPTNPTVENVKITSSCEKFHGLKVQSNHMFLHI